MSHRIYLNLKRGKQATVIDDSYGPIFGINSDFKIKNNRVFSNYHIFNNSYEKKVV
jgi:hypothetical protein